MGTRILLFWQGGFCAHVTWHYTAPLFAEPRSSRYLQKLTLLSNRPSLRGEKQSDVLALSLQ